MSITRKNRQGSQIGSSAHSVNAKNLRSLRNSSTTILAMGDPSRTKYRPQSLGREPSVPDTPCSRPGGYSNSTSPTPTRFIFRRSRRAYRRPRGNLGRLSTSAPVGYDTLARASSVFENCFNSICLVGRSSELLRRTGISHLHLTVTRLRSLWEVLLEYLYIFASHGMRCTSRGLRDSGIAYARKSIDHRDVPNKNRPSLPHIQTRQAS